MKTSKFIKTCAQDRPIQAPFAAGHSPRPFWRVDGAWQTWQCVVPLWSVDPREWHGPLEACTSIETFPAFDPLSVACRDDPCQLRVTSWPVYSRGTNRTGQWTSHANVGSIRPGQCAWILNLLKFFFDLKKLTHLNDVSSYESGSDRTTWSGIETLWFNYLKFYLNSIK